MSSQSKLDNLIEPLAYLSKQSLVQSTQRIRFGIAYPPIAMFPPSAQERDLQGIISNVMTKDNSRSLFMQ